ncbi:MAG: hypothetical protein HQM16_17855 [Deltaproteobacteria bacterium]|nr:hypothetical protein [Deltaproteobacteria bacterium]
MLRLAKSRVAGVIAMVLCICLVTLPVSAQVDRSGVRNIIAGKKSDDNVTGIRDLSDSGKMDAKEAGENQSGQGVSLGGMVNQVNVHVLGDVSKPGVFKIDISDRAADVVKRAGLNRATVRIIEVRHPSEKNRYYDLYQYYYFGDLEQNPYLTDNDTIFVPKHNGAVRVEWSVMRPGVYELSGEKNLHQIFQLAGGFSHGMSQMYPIKVIRFSDGGEKFVLEVAQEKTALKKFKIIKGDIFIVPDTINAKGDFDYTVEAIPGEQHVYPTANPEVYVIGAVMTPGPFPYKSHLTIKDYLGFAGATPYANLNRVKIISNGKRKSKKLYDRVNAGDVVVVKERNLDQFLKYLGIATTLMTTTLFVITFKNTLQNQ